MAVVAKGGPVGWPRRPSCEHVPRVRAGYEKQNKRGGRAGRPASTDFFLPLSVWLKSEKTPPQTTPGDGGVEGKRRLDGAASSEQHAERLGPTGKPGVRGWARSMGCCEPSGGDVSKPTCGRIMAAKIARITGEGRGGASESVGVLFRRERLRRGVMQPRGERQGRTGGRRGHTANMEGYEGHWGRTLCRDEE